jgi:hypothetical protein
VSLNSVLSLSWSAEFVDVRSVVTAFDWTLQEMPASEWTAEKSLLNGIRTLELLRRRWLHRCLPSNSCHGDNALSRRPHELAPLPKADALMRRMVDRDSIDRVVGDISSHLDAVGRFANARMPKVGDGILRHRMRLLLLDFCIRLCLVLPICSIPAVLVAFGD